MNVDYAGASMEYGNQRMEYGGVRNAILVAEECYSFGKKNAFFRQKEDTD